MKIALPFPVRLSIVLGTFGLVTSALYTLVNESPEVKEAFSIPRTISDVQKLQKILENLRDDQPMYLLGVYCLTYLFLQTFAIPGSVALSFLAGGLFGVWRGMLLVCALAMLGATGAYMVSALVMSNFIVKWLPERVSKFEDEGTYIGLIPATLLATRAGVAVQRLTTLQGVISLLPTLFSKQLKQRFDSNYGDKESQSPSIDLKKQR